MATLGPFTHILVPAGKAGKIYFAKDVAPFFETADFTRPDIGATSGATVFRDGQLIELAENEPDWSEPIGGGCPRLLMRPELTNLVIYSEPDTNPGSGSNVTYASNDWDLSNLGLSLEGKVLFGDNSTLRSYYSSESLSGGSGEEYTCFAIIKPSNGLTFTIGSAGTDLFNFRFANTQVHVQPFFSYTVEALGNGLFFMVVKSESPSTSTLNGIVKQASNSAITFEASAMQIIEGNLDVTYADYIKTVGASLTRSANSFEFTDLITKGVIGAGGVFSFILKTIWQDTGADVDILKFQTAASADQITLRAKTGGNLVLAYEDGGLTELGTGLAVDTLSKVGFSYNGSNLIFSVNGSTSGTATVTLGTITKVVCPAANRYFEIASDIYAAFSPIALNAADLNTETTA